VDVENILVVDDEEAIREVVSTMLESKGYHCTAVSNGRAAQDQVKHDPGPGFERHDHAGDGRHQAFGMAASI